MIKVVVQGIGPIGRETARLILQNKDFDLVGAIDPAYAGRDLGDLLDGKKTGVIIDNDTRSYRNAKGGTVVLATCSTLKGIRPQVEEAISNGLNIVTPCEELFYPEYVDKQAALDIDKLAVGKKVRIIANGVNPGCLMDAYPLRIVQEACLDELISLHVYRHDNTFARRLPLLQKTGAGLTEKEFYDLDKDGKLGHVGLKLSASYLADKLGLKNYKLDFKREPVIAGSNIKPLNMMREIQSGESLGLHEMCHVSVDGVEIIFLDLAMYVGVGKRNRTKYHGIKRESSITREIKYDDIVNGDVATVRILADSIRYSVCGPVGLNRTDYLPDPNRILM